MEPEQVSSNSSLQLEKIHRTFNTLNANNLNILDQFYDHQVKFRDPLVELFDLNRLKRYFRLFYRNVSSVHFQFLKEASIGHEHFLLWELTFKTRRILGGKTIALQGSSFFKFNERNLVTFHQDFFDTGFLLTKQLPLLGPLIQWIKKRVL